MAVLEVEAVEELAGIMLADPFQALGHRISGTAVASERVRALLRRHRCQDDDPGGLALLGHDGGRGPAQSWRRDAPCGGNL